MQCESIGLFLTISHHPDLGCAVVNGYGDKAGTAHRRGSQPILLLLLTTRRHFHHQPFRYSDKTKSKHEVFDLRMLQFVVSTSIFDDAYIPSVWHSLLFPKFWFSAEHCSGAGGTYCQNSISHTDRGVWTKAGCEYETDLCYWLWPVSINIIDLTDAAMVMHFEQDTLAKCNNQEHSCSSYPVYRICLPSEFSKHRCCI